MSNGINITNYPEFRSTLREYLKHTKRSLSTILDTKGFYIARGACRDTPKVESQQINRELGEIGVTLRLNRKGKLVKGDKIYVKAFGSDAPRAALIINARRGKKGLPGLEGKAMLQAIAKLINVRKKSTAFLKSGWLPAIRTLGVTAERKGNAPKIGNGIKQVGKDKGRAIAARPDSWTPSTFIENSASPDRDKKGALVRYAGPAFKSAWDSEIQSMKDYIEKKIQEENDKVNAR